MIFDFDFWLWPKYKNPKLFGQPKYNILDRLIVDKDQI